MHQQSDSYRERAACPLYTAIAVIGGRWKPMIYQRLASRPHGFGELERTMPRVRRKALREQLRQMQADGRVRRELLQPAQLGTRYHLTPYGRTLEPVFTTLWRWGVRHLVRKDAEQGTVVKPPYSTRDALAGSNSMARSDGSKAAIVRGR